MPLQMVEVMILLLWSEKCKILFESNFGGAFGSAEIIHPINTVLSQIFLFFAQNTSF